jgi:hypothetical protein
MGLPRRAWQCRLQEGQPWVGTSPLLLVPGTDWQS